jgi:ATP-dependent protease ClpP protease subunit
MKAAHKARKAALKAAVILAAAGRDASTPHANVLLHLPVGRFQMAAQKELTNVFAKTRVRDFISASRILQIAGLMTPANTLPVEMVSAMMLRNRAASATAPQMQQLAPARIMVWTRHSALRNMAQTADA